MPSVTTLLVLLGWDTSSERSLQSARRGLELCSMGAGQLPRSRMDGSSVRLLIGPMICINVLVHGSMLGESFSFWLWVPFFY